MLTLRRATIALFLCVGMLPLCSQSADDKAANNSAVKSDEHSLEVTTIGEIRVWNGRRGGFRVYKALDGTEGSVMYARFRTSRDADRQIKEWLNLAQTVTTKEQERNKSGVVVGERIIATAQNQKSGKEVFLIADRNNFDCYLVQSSSMSVGLQVEHMINAK